MIQQRHGKLFCFFVALGLSTFCPAENAEQANLHGGISIPYEILSMQGANWSGDGFTWGGLDRAAALQDDLSTFLVTLESGGNEASAEFEVTLVQDFSEKELQVTAGFRRNPNQTKRGRIFWDGQLLMTCEPHFNPSGSDPKGPIDFLDTQSVQCRPGDFDFSPGAHTIRLEADSLHLPKRKLLSSERVYFQLDALLLEQLSDQEEGFRLYLDQCEWIVPQSLSPVESLALERLVEDFESLTGKKPEILSRPALRDKTSIVIGHPGGYEPSETFNPSRQFNELSKNLSVEERAQAYLLEFHDSDSQKVLYAGGVDEPGTVYAISDLAIRLRHSEKGWYLDFPEWDSGAKSGRIFESPAAIVRGEYLNIGGNVPGFTVHEWDRPKWEEYLDELVLSRINRLYFFVWIDVHSMYPGTTSSQDPLTRHLHEMLRYAIEYAHRRGIEVYYGICPTYIPNEIWQQHPEMHADIIYAQLGFPCVCPRSPGAWELMKEVWRNEMEWFKEADGLHVFLYDPGGCWCTRYGCEEHQAEMIARQVREFGDLFRELNPEAKLEYNVWNIWYWEEHGKVPYRHKVHHELKRLFGEEYSQLSAVGATDNDIVLPLAEREAGLDTNVFSFGANPESGYCFLIPNLIFHKEAVDRIITGKGFDKMFGHRLEPPAKMASTFFMGHLLWKPELSIPEVTRRWTDWQMLSEDRGNLLGEAILLLDHMTYHKADSATALRIEDLARRAFEDLHSVWAHQLEYFLPMIEAIRVVACSASSRNNEAIRTFARDFDEALGRSELLAPLSQRSDYYFLMYRKYLGRGWKNGSF